ncbi:transglycosylase SLT domain-containing protein [Lysobacter sp. Hz 25]|uniref:transglycosylase SLT domain-containing protein n=1 Tax=Lysobacter sp. Hz 25 TaxID=3383698 RepID=UPI0038D355D9
MAQLIYPDIGASFREGQAFGTQQRQMREGEERRSALSNLAAESYTAAPQARTSILARMAALSPEAAQQQSEQFESGDDRRNKQLVNMAKLLTAAPESQKDSIYQQMRPALGQLGLQTVPDAYSPEVGEIATKLVRAWGPSSLQESFTLSPGSGRYDAQGKLLVQQPFSPDKPQLEVDVNGQPWFLAPGKAPISALGGGPAPAGGEAAGGGGFGIAETDNYVRSILGKVGSIDPNAPPEQLAQVLLPHLIQQESAGNPNAVSPKGARGLAQVMPATGQDPGFGVTALRDNSPEENVRFGRDYLTAMLRRYPGRPDLALAAYNAGPGVADRFAQPQASAGGASLQFPTKGNATTADKAANWQIIQGNDGQFYRANKLTNEVDSLGVTGNNAARIQKMETERLEKVQGIQGSITQTQTALDSIDTLLKAPGLDAAVGMGSMFPTAPGSDAANFEAQLDTFKAQTFVPMVSQLKGMGALSDAEGKKLSEAVGALNIKMSDSAFRASLSSVKALLETAKANAYRKITDINETARSHYSANPSPQGGGKPSGGYSVGQVINANGKRYRVTGGDPNDPDIEEVP